MGKSVSTQQSLEQLKAFYWKHMKEQLLPFWLERGIDEEFGGFFTCFDNSGSTLVSTDKYTWSQGRMVWLLAKLSSMDGFAPEERDRLLALSGEGARFMMRHAIMGDGCCTFVTDREGNAKRLSSDHDYAASIYADCFVLLGLSRYARESGDAESLHAAKKLYASIRSRIASGTYRTEPYPIPAGYRTHGIPMIMLNVSHELAEALQAAEEAGIAEGGQEECADGCCGNEAVSGGEVVSVGEASSGGNGDALAIHAADIHASEVREAARAYMMEIMDDFVTDDGTLLEMIPIGGSAGSVGEVIGGDSHSGETLLDRYVNPGHTIEDMWFVMELARQLGDDATIRKAVRVLKRALELGWDVEYGGILLFVDRDGGQPKGSMEGIADDAMAKKVSNDWGSKLWWPHSEALYSTVLGYKLTGDEELLVWYERVHAYTFRTFPNSDSSVGEWIQIRDREGNPQSKTVALPVKDPFHIIRNLIQLVEEL
ncbi:AGE family epimerase/isomerase [Paenibacillus sp. J5C_2022]|uniref:AGE family epimerase/isomerase n=1 Tax=Paenibacillus sp. J5C2022 TaxID=2977129 RepID=UPI0021D38792|nr:AGE family epimerase/isomerase [Paenibacillus sp. J5C2022]MCU6708794.1 AGE family epimerase/isomerase [Paenibacillus sp. J5C2022]